MIISKCTDFYRQIIHTQSKDEKIKNPFTKRMIFPFKDTGNKLFAQCHQLRPIQSACQSEKDLPFVPYQGNSCYKDTLLLSLFLRPPSYILKTILHRNITDIPYKHPFLCGSTREQQIENILSIQYGLRKLTTYLQLYPLDKDEILMDSMNHYLDPILKKYCSNAIIRKFTQQQQNDPEEFAQLLFDFFPLEKNDRGKIRRKTYYYTPNETSRRKGSVIYEDFEVIQILSREVLQQHPKPLFEIDPDLYHTIQSTVIDVPPRNIPPQFSLKKDFVSFEKFPKLFFIKIQRADFGSTVFLTKPVFPNLFLSSTSLHLFAIICKLDRNIHSGHYGGFIRCHEIWYFYDDLHSSRHFVKIGSFSSLFHHPSYSLIALTQSILLLYNHSSITTKSTKSQSSLLTYVRKRSLEQSQS